MSDAASRPGSTTTDSSPPAVPCLTCDADLSLYSIAVDTTVAVALDALVLPGTRSVDIETT